VELADAQIFDLMDLPSDFRLTPVQKRVVDCVRSGRSWVSPALGDALDQLEWPIAYLDFETVMTALPLCDNLPPYAQVTTQYSIHRRQGPDDALEHVEYLADPMRDYEEEWRGASLTIAAKAEASSFTHRSRRRGLGHWRHDFQNWRSGSWA
jgi:hypothetical protein